jgi:Ca2+-binding RTX toxin-like protein
LKPTLRRLLAGTAIALLLTGGAVLAWGKTVRGTNRGEVLVGTNHRDRISGLGGNDTIYAQRNSDRVLAGKGNDTVYAGTGNDSVRGGPGRDALYGGLGNDRLFGDRAADFLYGGPGDDDLWAQTRRDVRGKSGEAGDSVKGGPGNDRFHVRDGEADGLACGPGYDRVFADRLDVVDPNCERVSRRRPR